MVSVFRREILWCTNGRTSCLQEAQKAEVASSTCGNHDRNRRKTATEGGDKGDRCKIKGVVASSTCGIVVTAFAIITNQQLEGEEGKIKISFHIRAWEASEGDVRNYRWMDIRKFIPVTYRTSALWGRCPKSEKDIRCMFNRETGKHQWLEIKNQRDLRPLSSRKHKSTLLMSNNNNTLLTKPTWSSLSDLPQSPQDLHSMHCHEYFLTDTIIFGVNWEKRRRQREIRISDFSRDVNFLFLSLFFFPPKSIKTTNFSFT